MTLADPEGAKRVVHEFVDLLERHRAMYRTAVEVAGEHAQLIFKDNLQELNDQILERHGQVASIAERVNPGLVDLIRGRMGTSPFTWKFQAMMTSARILKGQLDRLEETAAIVGPGPPAVLSSPEDRSSYGRALLARGAVDPVHAVSSREVAAELGLDDRVRDDVESWLHAAGLLEFVTQGPTVSLTLAGRSWAEQGASLSSPPPGSTTAVVVNVESGAVVGSVQAAGAGSTQVVVPDLSQAVAEWVKSAKRWLASVETVDLEARGLLVARLDDLEEEVGIVPIDQGRVSRLMEKCIEGARRLGVDLATTVGADALLEGGRHLIRML